MERKGKPVSRDGEEENPRSILIYIELYYSSVVTRTDGVSPVALPCFMDTSTLCNGDGCARPTRTASMTPARTPDHVARVRTHVHRHPRQSDCREAPGRRGYCPVRVVGTGQGLRRTERRTGSANRSVNKSANRQKNIGQHIIFPMSLSFRISAIVVIEAGRQDRPANRPEDRPDFRSFHLDRLKNKSLISHGIGQ